MKYWLKVWCTHTKILLVTQKIYFWSTLLFLCNFWSNNQILISVLILIGKPRVPITIYKCDKLRDGLVHMQKKSISTTNNLPLVGFSSIYLLRAYTISRASIINWNPISLCLRISCVQSKQSILIGSLQRPIIIHLHHDRLNG